MQIPYLHVEGTGESFPLGPGVNTVGRGEGVDVPLRDPTVSRLHAEVVVHGPHAYVADLGLSANGTLVNGRPVGRQVLESGDVVTFGGVRCRVAGLPPAELEATAPLRRVKVPELTRRELEVLASLCRPALTQEAFVAPATSREIAEELFVTDAAVKQHLVRLYQKFGIPEGPNRRARLANEVIAAGLVRLLPEPGGSAGVAAVPSEPTSSQRA